MIKVGRLMDYKKNKKIIMFLLMLLNLILISGCRISQDKEINYNKEDATERKIKIGFSMGTLKEERWQRDRDIFVAKAKELGAEVIVQNANNDSNEQMSQVKYLLEQGIDILVIVPHDADKAASIVQMAKKEGIKVISYDRLVRNANVDMYISFDNVKVGELMAEHLVKSVPAGNYVIINGAKNDYNTHMFNEGYKNVLKPYIDMGNIDIIEEIWAEDWKREDAFKCVERTLQNGYKIDGIIAANDSLAEAVIEALAERRLAGRIPVVGHDADLAGCQRVAEGTQLMTIYKPINRIAQISAETAIKMAKGEEIKANSSINDGKYSVPYYKIQSVPVIRENLINTVIYDGFHRLDDVFRNVPKSQWPVIK
jgi:D-xylose transport system substrate-binding protein